MLFIDNTKNSLFTIDIFQTPGAEMSIIASTEQQNTPLILADQPSALQQRAVCVLTQRQETICLISVTESFSRCQKAPLQASRGGRERRSRRASLTLCIPSAGKILFFTELLYFLKEKFLSTWIALLKTRPDSRKNHLKTFTWARQRTP